MEAGILFQVAGAETASANECLWKSDEACSRPVQGRVVQARSQGVGPSVSEWFH